MWGWWGLGGGLGFGGNAITSRARDPFTGLVVRVGHLSPRAPRGNVLRLRLSAHRERLRQGRESSSFAVGSGNTPFLDAVARRRRLWCLRIFTRQPSKLRMIAVTGEHSFLG